MKKKHVYHSKELDSLGHASYSNEENETWSFLLNRQKELIDSRASKEFIKGLELLNFPQKIPQHDEVTSVLNKHTGWGVEPVPALIQPEHFFSLLANKRFPAANFIRIPEEIDYIQEPDVFHEFFGHCPLLTNSAYAEFMNEYGKLALEADAKTKIRLFRLFWFTIEFGLIREDMQFKAYGGGILSSKSEVIYSTESEIPERHLLDPLNALRTPFRIDILQPVYFVIESYEDLFKLLEKKPLRLALESMSMPDFPPNFQRKKGSKKMIEKLSELNAWSFNTEKNALEKEFQFKSYLKNIAFVNAVAWIANKDNHHPDLIVKYNSCRVILTTHDQGGISQKDFDMAKKIDLL